MAFPPSLVRVAEFEAMRKLTLHGAVIDLGGGKDSGYRTLFKGEYTTVSANLDGHETTDIHCDLEKPLPIADAAYDGVLMINTLEHIYHCHELVRESFRITRAGGDVVIVVPFLFPVHPSPSDFWRYTDETLKRMLQDAGYTDVSVIALAPGVCTVQFILFERLMPPPVRTFMYYCIAPLATFADAVFVRIAGVLGKKYDKAQYASGYLAVAKKPLA